MMVHIGQAFLRDPEESSLNLLGAALRFVGTLELNLDAASFRKAPQIIAESSSEAKLLQGRWMEEVGEGAQITRCFGKNGEAIGDQIPGGPVTPFRFVFEPAEIDRDHREVLQGRVVQLAGNATALFILRFQDQRRKLAQHQFGPFAVSNVGSETQDGLRFAVLVEKQCALSIYDPFPPICRPRGFRRGIRRCRAASP